MIPIDDNSKIKSDKFRINLVFIKTSKTKQVQYKQFIFQVLIKNNQYVKSNTYVNYSIFVTKMSHFRMNFYEKNVRKINIKK